MAGRTYAREIIVGCWVSLSLLACSGRGATPLPEVPPKTPDGGDMQAPSVPAGLSASAVAQTSFNLEWAASTDNVGVTGYEVFQTGVSKGLATSTSFAVTGLTAATTYAMTVRARDAAGNWSAQSAPLNVTTASSSASPDTQPPTVAVSSPANGATVGTTFGISATASDNVGVAGVQFFLDGSAAGAEVTAAPYSVTVSTTAAKHTIYAHARDAAGNSSDSTTITVTSSAAAAGTSIEFGRTLYGTDDSLRNDAPSGGTLFSVWTKIPDPGPIPWSRGNMDDYVLYGRNWYMRCLTGNGSATSATSASFNANSMLFVNPGETWVDDYSYYLGTMSESQVRGWVWAAWQVVVNADSFTIRQWLKFGLNGAVIAAGESNPTFTEIRSTLVSQRGLTTAQATAWVPGDATSFHVGKDNGYLTHARMAATSTIPTLAALDTIARSNAADTSAWADYELVWVNGAPNLADRSGHGRNLSIEAGGTLYAGPAGPAF